MFHVYFRVVSGIQVFLRSSFLKLRLFKLSGRSSSLSQEGNAAFNVPSDVLQREAVIFAPTIITISTIIILTSNFTPVKNR